MSKAAAMSRNLSAEEVRQQYITAMGQDLGAVAYSLYNEVAWLHVRWRAYTELFDTKLDRVDLLNSAASAFFRLVQDAMREDTLLHLSRITDRPKVAGKDTLTIQRLPGLVSDTTLAAELQNLVDAALAKTKFARDWRNRRIAHTDLLLALGQGAQLEPASRQGVREALEAIAIVLNRLEVAYLGTAGTMYDQVVVGLGDAESLLYVIRDGVEAREAQKRRLLEGRPLPEDYGPPRPI